MEKIPIHKKILTTADEYHIIAEEQWRLLTELDPINEELVFEFKRLSRASLMFYCRAYLILDLIETDEEQTLEELLEISSENMPELEDYITHNKVLEILNVDLNENISKVFACTEVARTLLLERSNNAAGTLFERF